MLAAAVLRVTLGGGGGRGRTLLPNPPLRLRETREKKFLLMPREKLQLLKTGKQGPRPHILNLDCSGQQQDVSGLRMV